ncbi:hypothetical protein TNCV_3085251 [Trichonephila clavipes]|nr:hypothetical protein TNCV_3085251 [Trichonephila clavipes]
MHPVQGGGHYSRPALSGKAAEVSKIQFQNFVPCPEKHQAITFHGSKNFKILIPHPEMHQKRTFAATRILGYASAMVCVIDGLPEYPPKLRDFLDRISNSVCPSRNPSGIKFSRSKDFKLILNSLTQLHGISYILGDSCHVTYLSSSHRYSRIEIFNRKKGCFVHQTIHGVPEEFHA